MPVYIYKGGLRLVEKSGVGRAIHHQERVLQAAGIPLAEGWRDAEVVHFNTVFPDSALVALVSRLCRKKVVYFGHSTQEDFRSSFRGSNRLSPLFKRWIRLCCSLGDVVVTPTEYSKGLLEGYGLRPPVRALSNGIDTDFFAPSRERGRAFRQKYGLGDGDRAAISVGHYIERKGLLEFLEVARRLPGVRFFWFGYTDPALIPKKIRDAIANPPENVRFPGYVGREDLRDAYCGADAFLFLSREETEGIVVLEALACGAPTILRDIPVYRGWLTDGENVHKAEDVPSAAEKLSLLLSGHLPDLTGAGRETALSRSYRAVAVRLAEIYSEQGLSAMAAGSPAGAGLDL